jgi:hypothetical protein
LQLYIQERYNLERHLKSNKHLKKTGQLVKEVKYYHCDHPDCDYKSNRKWNLEQHIETHSDKHTLKCNACDFTCRGTKQIKRHIKTERHKKTVLENYENITVKNIVDGRDIYW